MPISVRGPIQALFASLRSAVCLSRILLIVLAVEAITMPVTQGIWSWDKFLHGGQDFELGLLIIVSCLGLVLLRVQQNRNRSGWLAVIRAMLKSPKIVAGLNLISSSRSWLEHRTRIPSPFRTFTAPLLI